MANILLRLEEDEKMELDKVRIWDFYVLFPSKVYDITIRRSEDEMRKVRAAYVKRDHNPYEYKGDNRKLFEWIKPVQVSALGCLVSCGILSKEEFETGNVLVVNSDKLKTFVEKVGDVSVRENNILSFLSFLFGDMPLTGVYGMKYRTKLLESKYDA